MGSKSSDVCEEGVDGISFASKVILAPMVRTATLPMRLLSLKFGAHIVYTEEIIDYKLIKCKRFVNSVLGTIDYIDDDGVIVFRTCSAEKDRLVLQLGTSDASRAVIAAKLVEEDVSAIDVNMGCPKSFSIKGGMGSALLTQPQKVYDILNSLVKNIGKPITCKIRVLPSIEETLSLVQLIEKSGVKALAVHGRTQSERPKDKNRNDLIRAIAQTLNIPVIANGGSDQIQCYADIERFRLETCCSSVMLGRVAQKNASIFINRQSLLPMDDVIEQYLKLCVDFDNNVINTKYVIQQMLGPLQDTPRGKALLSAQSLKTICDLWHLNSYCDNRESLKRELSSKLFNEQKSIPIKKFRTSEDNEEKYFVEMPVIFMRGLFKDNDLPKSRLLSYIQRNSLEAPVYQTKQIEKHFNCVLTLNKKSYSSLYLEKNKRYAEQGSALVVLLALNLIDDSNIVNNCVVNDLNRIEVKSDSKTFYIKIS